jgi:hypothetical protein
MGNQQGKLGRLRKLAGRVLVEPEPQPRRPEPLFALPGIGEVMADVILDPDAQPRLEWLAEVSPDPGGSRQVFASVARPAGGGEQGEQIVVRQRSHRIGTLSAADSAGLWGYLDEAAAQGRRVAVMALGDQDANGTWALRICLPRPKPGQPRSAPPAGGTAT